MSTTNAAAPHGVPPIYSEDPQGNPLTNMVLEGSYCTRNTPDPNVQPSCDSLEDYGWSDFRAHSTSFMGMTYNYPETSFTFGPRDDLALFFVHGTCTAADARHMFIFRGKTPPPGYQPIEGEAVFCASGDDEWIELSNTTNGGIRYERDTNNPWAHPEYPNDTGFSRFIYTHHPIATPPLIAKTDNNGQGLVGMSVGGTSCTRTDTASDFACTDLAQLTALDLSTSSTSSGLQTLTFNTGGVTGCDATNALHTLTISEATAPSGYDAAPGNIVLCQDHSTWRELSNSTNGLATYDATANRVTFVNNPTPPTTTTTTPATTTTTPATTTTTATTVPANDPNRQGAFGTPPSEQTTTTTTTTAAPTQSRLPATGSRGTALITGLACLAIGLVLRRAARTKLNA